MTRARRATEMLLKPISDAQDKSPLIANVLGAGIIAFAFLKPLTGTPLYIAVGLGIACNPWLKRQVLGMATSGVELYRKFKAPQPPAPPFDFKKDDPGHGSDE